MAAASESSSSELMLKELHELAAQVLSEESELDARLDLAEQYCQKFQAWADSYPQSKGDNSGNVEIRDLATKHAQILSLIRDLSKSAKIEMKVFQKRAKGIMAYVDTLPASIGTMPKKKG